MITLPSLLLFAHLIGLALALGSASSKLVLLLRVKKDPEFAQTFLAVARPVTRLIILGLALLTLSGIGWLLLGYSFTPLLIIKLILVVTVWVLGPIIDNVIEPEFRKLAPHGGETATPEFARVTQRYVLVEFVATGLFYAVVILWIFG